MFNNWGRHYLPNVLSNASVASGGADARVTGQIGPFGQEARLVSWWWTPTSGDQGAAASYRRFLLYNGGSANSVTATANILGSLNLSASKASLLPYTGTVVYPASASNGSAGYIDADEILYFSQLTVVGTDATGTVLRAGDFSLLIEFTS